MRIHCFQHVPFETPSTILEWVNQHGHYISYTYFFEKAFVLPALIASSEVCTSQAFIIDKNVLALQFHLEMGKDVIEKLISHCEEELREKGEHIQTADEIRRGYHYLELNKKDIFLLLDEFFRSD